MNNIADQTQPSKPSEPHKQPNLYPAHLTLLNITNFTFVLNTDICNVKEISLVTIVHTAVTHQVYPQGAQS